METLGQFAILARLGTGMLGELLRARDTVRDTVVALRVVDAGLVANAAAREALLADARSAAGVTHPSLASLLDIVEQDGRLLLVHELASGRPLAAVTAAGAVEPHRAVEMIARAAEGVAAAARRGLVHGSLDPLSIIASDAGEVKVLDLGLSSWTGHGIARRAAAGAMEGTASADDPALLDVAPYVAPEQVLGSPGDARSDVFSLGAILYRLLTGSAPFACRRPGESGCAAEILLNVLQASPPPPSQSNPAVPPALDEVVQHALAKSVDARYADAGALAEDLRRVQASMAATTTRSDRPLPDPRRELPARATPSREPQPRPARRWLVPALASVVVLAALAAAAWYGRESLARAFARRDATPPRPVVLVLPFAVSGEHAPAYFGPGFAEDVAARLSEIPGSAVVGRASIRALDANVEWQARARKLGATVAVRGSIRPGQYALHADVEIVDAVSGARTWTRHFQREPRQVSGLQAEIAAQLAQQLQLTTPTSNRWARASVRQIDPAAYDLYLQGRDAADHRDRSKAIALYDEALERDPRLVEARASLSQAIYLEEYYAGSSREPASAGRALREAEAALAVDAELPAAHVAAALAAPTVTMAASALAKALSYDPSNGEAWHYAGDLVSELDPPRSIAFYRASLALEPSIDANWRDIAGVQAAMGNYAAAEQAITKGEAARPDRPWWKQMRARVDIQQQRYDRAVDALMSDPSVESTPIAWLMGRVVPLSTAGRLVDARREGSRMVERYPGFCEGRAVMAAVELDGGLQEQGRQTASAIVGDASRADAAPAARVCAALAAAATGDAAEAASWLSRVAADERALRLWTRQATFGVGLSFKLQWYPWTKVLGTQPMQVAGSQLERSLLRLRDEVERRLPVPPGQTAQQR